jgi:hypothetical protein
MENNVHQIPPDDNDEWAAILNIAGPHDITIDDGPRRKSTPTFRDNEFMRAIR